MGRTTPGAQANKSRIMERSVSEAKASLHACSQFAESQAKESETAKRVTRVT